MRTKSTQFSLFLSSSCYPLYVLTETWMKPGVLSSEFFNDNYVTYRCDRSSITSDKSDGGGVLVAVHNSIINCDVVCPNNTVEHVAVKLSWTGKSLYLYAAYVPPLSSAEVYGLHCANVDYFLSECSIHDIICVLGDFNLPGLCWCTDEDDTTSVFPSNVTSEVEQIFIDTMLSFNLHQICKVANVNGRILDLVLLNDPNCGLVTKSLEPFVSDRLHHSGLEINFDELFCKFINVTQPKLIYSFEKADIAGLQEFFEKVDWDETFNSKLNDVNALVDSFYFVLLDAFDKYVPKCCKRKNNHPPWFDDNLVNLRNRKNKAHTIAKVFGDNPDCLNSFLQLRRAFDKEQRRAYRNYISQLENNLISNPKLFWPFVDVKRKCSGYPQMMSLNDVTASNAEDICELFADFFQSVYKKYSDNAFEVSCGPLTTHHQNVIGIPHISENDVSLGISKMKSGCGFDNIPAKILKDLNSSLSLPLSLIFNASLKSGVFPLMWKKSIIIPIFKSGKRSNIENYRGISILSSIPKLFELIVSDYLYFSVKSSFALQQHGFVRHRSTTTNLLSLTSRVFSAFDSKCQLDVVFTDFAKAFDSPQFELLLAKLDKFGVSQLFLNWIGSYLRDRKQVVQINGFTSKTIEVHSGVPQGTHLGPVLFNIFINEIASLFQYCDCELYADDLKISKAVCSVQQCIEMQSDLDLLYKWSVVNRLNLNLEKCKIMSFSKKTSIIHHQYLIGNHQLERVMTFKDLGVVLDHQLNFRDHIDLIVAKSNSLLGFIRRITKDFRNPQSIKTLYCSIVRSILEYASIIWDPAYNIHIDRIERIQKKFIIYYLHKLNWPFASNIPMWLNIKNLPSYDDRCRIADLDSLLVRRRCAASTFIADLLNSSIDFPELLAKIDIHVPCKPARVRNFIYLPTFKTNYAYNAPIPAISRQFNNNFGVFDFNISKCTFKKKIKSKL